MQITVDGFVAGPNGFFDLLENRQKLSLLNATVHEGGVSVISYKLNNDLQ